LSGDRFRLVVAGLVVIAAAVVIVLVIRSRGGPEGLCDLGRDNREAIIGHDVGVSTVLPDGNTLFLFGDTWVGTIEDGERQIASQTSNSGAVLPSDNDICNQDLGHLLNQDGSVRQLIPLRRGDDVETIAHWPVDSIVVGDQIVTYYRRVDRGSSLRTLQFNVLGTGVATAGLDTLEFTLAEGDLFTRNEHVAAAEIDPQTGLVYVLVCDQSLDMDIFAPCLSGRVAAQSIADEDAYEFYAGDGVWTPNIEEAVDVLDNGESEMTLHLADIAGETLWVVTYVPPFTCRVSIRTAPAPWGPYSDEVEIYEADAESRGGSRCYGGKLHPEFSSAERLVITWVSSGTLDQTLENPDTYWPHAVEVDPP
jgi:Domain of unknown function (DUF4185)